MIASLESKLVLGLDKGSPFGVRYLPHYLVAACGMETTASAKETASPGRLDEVGDDSLMFAPIFDLDDFVACLNPRNGPR